MLKSGHMQLKAAIGERFENNFANPFKNAVEKKRREENNGNRKAFCVTRKRSKKYQLGKNSYELRYSPENNERLR